MTEKQAERQKTEHRSKGRYSITNACEICGKSAGIDYYSLEDHNETGVGVCVCEKCYLHARNENQ